MSIWRKFFIMMPLYWLFNLAIDPDIWSVEFWAMVIPLAILQIALPDAESPSKSPGGRP